MLMHSAFTFSAANLRERSFYKACQQCIMALVSDRASLKWVYTVNFCSNMFEGWNTVLEVFSPERF